MTRTIPLASLPQHYPHFLSTPGDEPNLLTTDSVPERLRDLDRFTEAHRSKLVDAITADLARWNAPESARESVEKLRASNAYAVVTGQQAGVATGPLYTLYKAVGAIAMAESLARHFPEHSFVPVFWIEGDDHDFDEARTITLLERSGDPRTIRYDDGESGRLHVGDRLVHAEGLKSFLDEVREVVGDTDFSDDLFTRIKEAYSNGTLADGFARSMYAFLGETPLVLLSSRNRAIKHLAADIFSREAEQPERLYDALRSRTNDLASRALPTPIEPKPGALFLTHKGERRSLEPDGNTYVVKGTDRRIDRETLAEEAREHPDRFSANVALRPIVQDAILPTAIYLGGPSEAAYLRQLRDAYSSFDMEQPCIAPRPFVTLIEPKVARVLESSSIGFETFFDPEFDPAFHLIDREKSDRLSALLEQSQKGLRDVFEGLQEITGEIDKSLENTLGASGRKAEKELENFGSRLHAALKRKSETEITRLEGARSLLLPAGKLQERILNPIYYANKYGLDALRQALAEIIIAPGTMQMIDL